MTSTRIPIILLRSLQLFVVVGFSIYVLAFIEHSFEVMTYPWSVDYVEAPELNRALRIAQGKDIYPSWESPPFLESNYTPFFAVLNSFLIDVDVPMYWPGRLFNVVLTFVTAGLIARIVFVQSATLWQGLLGGMIYLSSHIVWMWGSLLRVDTLAVWFNIMALWVFLEPSWKQSKSKMTIISVLCLCAAFTRQTMIASFVSIAAIVLWKQRSLFARLSFVYVLGGMLGVGLLWTWSGGYAYTHLVEANINAFSWHSVKFFFSTMWSLYHAFLPVMFIGIWFSRKEMPVLVVYGLCALLVSLTIGKVGASLNYLMELWAIVSIFVAVGIGSFSREDLRGVWSSIALSILLLVGWQQILHIPWYRSPKPQGGLTAKSSAAWERFMNWTSALPLGHIDPFGVHGAELRRRSIRVFSSYRGEWEASAMNNIEHNLPAFPGPILSEDMNFTVTGGRDIWIQPFAFTQFSQQGLWSDAPLRKAISEQYFSLVILLFDVHADISQTPSADRFSLSVRQELAQSYELVSKEGIYWIYRPK